MVVDDMANMPPRKRLSMLDHPNRWPTMLPSDIMQNMTAQAAMMGPAPMRNIFLNENSRPRVNIRKITPMSAQVCMLPVSATVGVKEKWGPARKPATIYPRTRGWPRRLKMRVTRAAHIRMRARSEMMAGR